jgi:hypothetical protein
MHRLFRCAGLLVLSVAFVVPGVTSAQDKKDDTTKPKKDDPKAKSKLKVKPDWGIEMYGKLTALDDKDEKALQFTVQITVMERDLDQEKQLVQHNQTLANQQKQLLQHQASLAKAKNLNERNNALNQIAQTQQQIAQTQQQIATTTTKLKKAVNQDKKCIAMDSMRVRFHMTAGEKLKKIDPDTGEYKDMTKEEQDALVGTEGYPGYKVDTSKLKVGQMVYVYVGKDAKSPEQAMEQAAKDNKGKPPDDIKTAVDQAKANHRWDVIMIYIATDPPQVKDKDKK